MCGGMTMNDLVVLIVLAACAVAVTFAMGSRGR